jgi:hypothetical protein
MDYPEYEHQQELASQGDHIPVYMAAIFADACCCKSTLSSLQRRIYKDTDAGISISFRLDDGTYIWPDTILAADEKLVSRVRAIGFSSIVEGSEREVSLQWLDLLSEDLDTPEKAVAEFNQLVQETNDEACTIWSEEHFDDISALASCNAL